MAKRPPNAKSLEMIAKRLILTRKAMKLNQSEWCQRVGIGAAAWNNYERAKRRMSLDQAIKVFEAVGVTMEWIYLGLMAGMPNDLAREIQKLDSGYAAQTNKLAQRPREGSEAHSRPN